MVFADMLTVTFEYLPEADDDTKPNKIMPVAALASAVIELRRDKVFPAQRSPRLMKARPPGPDAPGRAMAAIMRGAIEFATDWIEDSMKRPFAWDY